MKLDKTLNFKKVRCVKGYDDCLEIGKEYEVIDISVEIKVKDDEGEILYWESDYFEPVLESAENPPQNIELTPEFEAEASEPKFKVGSGFYFGLNSKIYIVKKCTDNEIFANDPYDPIELLSLRKIHCCPATPENYERLQATFPDIEFEQPPKELAGSDLARALIKKGWVGFNCLCGHIGDEHAITETIVIGINDDGKFITFDGRLFDNAIPMNGWRPLKAQEVGL